MLKLGWEGGLGWNPLCTFLCTYINHMDGKLHSHSCHYLLIGMTFSYLTYTQTLAYDSAILKLL